jgi:hypothetical protein
MQAICHFFFCNRIFFYKLMLKVTAEDDVNGKTTTVEVMGKPDTGFTYTVEWFDDAFLEK